MGIASIMDRRLKLLETISEALETGVITKNDLQVLIANRTSASPSERKAPRVSAVDIMFYIAGIVLFAAIIALISQSWDSGVGMRISLSTGIGTLLWTVALYLLRLSGENDMRRGMTGALLLTGSLSIIAGGFIIAHEFVDYTDFNFYATAATLALLGALHLGFGSYIKKDLIVLLGVLLAVTAFPSIVFGLLRDGDMPLFVNCLIVTISGGLLAYATRVTSMVGIGSKNMARAFDSLSAFTVLMSLYAASYDNDTGLLWLLVLIGGIVGLFYLSIITQDKLMLGNGSFFMVLAIITISFRYFSGYGVATSLFIGAAGLIGTAIVATIINRRYLK